MQSTLLQVLELSFGLKFVCTHWCSYEITYIQKEQSIAYIYILKTFHTIQFLKIIINALSFI